MSVHDHDCLVASSIEETEQFLDWLAAKYPYLDPGVPTIPIGDLVQVASRIGDSVRHGLFRGYR